MRHLSTFLSLLLTPLVAVMPLSAELASSSEASSTSTTPGQSNILKIRLADDSKATVEANAIVKGYAILVTDSAGLPVPDAVVAVRLPDDGPSGYFLNGERSAVAYTDASGIAKFPQVNWGSTTGPLSVRVTVVKGELHAGVLIEQTVVSHATAKARPAPATAPTFLPDVTAPPQMAANPAAASALGTPGSVPSGASPMGASSNAPVNTPALAQTKPAVKTPGVPTSVAAVHSAASPEAAADTAQATDPNVSVVNTAGSKASNGNAKKWVIVAAVVAGASLGAALALAGHGGAAGGSGTASTGTSIGTPVISVGH